MAEGLESGAGGDARGTMPLSCLRAKSLSDAGGFPMLVRIEAAQRLLDVWPAEVSRRRRLLIFGGEVARGRRLVDVAATEAGKTPKGWKRRVADRRPVVYAMRSLTVILWLLAALYIFLISLLATFSCQP